MKYVLKVLGWILTMFAILGGWPTMMRGGNDAALNFMALLFFAILLFLAWLCFRYARKMEQKAIQKKAIADGVQQAESANQPAKKKGMSSMTIAVLVSIGMLVISRAILRNQEEKYRAIRSQIEQFNRMCPLPTADGKGTIVGAKVDGDFLEMQYKYTPGNVDLEDYKASPDAARDLLLASVLMAGSNGEQFLQQVTDDGLGMIINIDDGSDKTFSSKMSKDYILTKTAEIRHNPTEALRQAIALKCKAESKELPTEMEQGMSIISIGLEGGNIVTTVLTDETIYDINALRDNLEDIKAEMLKSLDQQDHEMKAFINMCKVSHYGLVYRFIGSQSSKTVDLAFSYDDFVSSAFQQTSPSNPTEY